QTRVESKKDSYGRIAKEQFDLYVAPDGEEVSYETKAIINGINGLTDSEKYLHVVATDRANNVSSVKSVQIKELMQQFRVTEKYVDENGATLQADTTKEIARDTAYTN